MKKNIRLLKHLIIDDITVSRNYEYLCRTVGRFQRLLKSKDSKIFLLIFRHHIDLDLYFDELYDALASKTKNFSLICISLDEFKSDDIYKIKNTSKKFIIFYTLSTKSDESKGAIFDSIIDDCLVISTFQQYKCNLKDKI